MAKGESEKLSRRALFGRLRGREEKAKPLKLTPRLRPPGAVAEVQFLRKCTSCKECVNACPHNAIFTLADWVQPGAGTPIMKPKERSCHMCEGFPCAEACPEGVLQVPEQKNWKLGSIEIDESTCLPMKFPFGGPECGACAGYCPDGVGEAGKGAIKIVRNKPEVDASSCVGCGLCLDKCVVQPSAIRFMPTTAAKSEHRPLEK